MLSILDRDIVRVSLNDESELRVIQFACEDLPLPIICSRKLFPSMARMETLEGRLIVNLLEVLLD